MRTESVAALANFLLALLLAVGVTVTGSLAGDAGAVVYANPVRSALRTAAMVLLVATPLATLASWRTWVHAQRVIADGASGWRGVLEAGALGFMLTLPYFLPGVLMRQFNPGQWGQPQAFFVGLAYVGFYGMLGGLIGVVLGSMLWGSARAVLFIHRHVDVARRGI